MGFVVALLSLSCLATGSAVEVEVLSTTKDAAPGTFATHVFAVTNVGPDPDSYVLDFHAPVGWSVLGAPGSIALLAGEEGTLFVTTTIPSGTQAGQYETILVATSETDPAHTTTVSAPTIVSPVNEVQILPPAAASVAPGGAVTYEFEIVNRGNAQDSYLVIATSSLGLSLGLSEDSIQLAPQERRIVQIRLTVPAETSTGRDVLTFAVSSSLYDGVSSQVSVFTTILPPSPGAIGGNLMETLPARFRLSMNKDVLEDTFDSRMTFSISGRVNAGYFSAFVSASDPLGPNAVNAESYSILYRLQPSTFALGNTSKRLTDLVSLSCEGASLEIDAETFRIVFVGGGYEDETRVAGHMALGPDAANLGLAYRGVRSESVQESLWSARAAAEPFEDWQIRAEGAIGLDGQLTSRAFFFNSRIDTPGYYLNAEAYSVGTHFPGSLADSEGISLSQRLRLDALSLSVSLSHEHNNVIGDPLAITLIRDDLGLNLATSFLEDGPTVTTTVDFQWDRYPDLTKRSDMDTLLGFSITESAGVFPYTFSGKIADQIDHAFDTHYRTSTFSEGVGLSIDSFYLFLTLTQEKHVNMLTDEVLSSAADVSFRFRPQGAIHEASISLGNTQDDFDLSAALYIRFLDDLDLIFDGSITWDRHDANELSFGWGITLNADLAVPIPFFVTKGRIEGRVFIDRNGNGAYDVGEVPAPGSVVIADRTEVSTDESGTFRFPPFYAGEFSLSVRQLPINAAAGEPITVLLAAGETRHVDVPLTPLLHLSGTLFDDLNRNGEADEGEGGFSQVRVVLESDGVSRDAYTDLRGGFSFLDVRRGAYTVRVDEATIPARFLFTTPVSLAVTVAATAPAPIAFGGYVPPREVIVTFQPPTADFFVDPDPAIAGEPAILDGTFSFDFDGEIVTYAWDFDADGIIDSTEPMPEVVFPSPGTYDVTLTVTDDGGNSDTITYSVVAK